MAEKLPRGITYRADREARYRVRAAYEGKIYHLGDYFTLGDAKAALAIYRSQMARQIFVPPLERRRLRKEAAARSKAEALTVREWSQTWLAELEKLGRSPGTLKTYTSTLKVHALDLIGDKRLVDVTTKDVERLAAGTTPATSYNITRTMSAMLGAAVAAGKLPESPVTSGFKKTSRPKDDSTTVELDDVAKLAALMPESLGVSVWLAATMGLRLGEVLGLQRQDLDLDAEDGPVLHIRRQWLIKASPPRYADPKAGSAGTLAIPESLVPVLRDHLKRFIGPGPESPLLPSTVNKKAPISQSSFDKQWRAARDQVKAGLHYHDLRAVALTLYNRQGATAEELMRRGRHTDMDTARVYQGATSARDRMLTAKLDESLREVLR